MEGIRPYLISEICASVRARRLVVRDAAFVFPPFALTTHFAPPPTRCRLRRRHDLVRDACCQSHLSQHGYRRTREKVVTERLVVRCIVAGGVDSRKLARFDLQKESAGRRGLRTQSSPSAQWPRQAGRRAHGARPPIRPARRRGLRKGLRLPTVACRRTVKPTRLRGNPLGHTSRRSS